ncbi:MAG: hypothetical protein H6509_02475 [Bryobacterales bacterium]|nr:hypothetical protein [Bryobacterales bacterium]
MANVVFRCHSCGVAIPLAQGEKIVRRDECPKCGADLKCCLNCMSYDPSRSNQCADSAAEWVSDKETRNFCDMFSPRISADIGAGPTKKAADPRKAFDDLFK